jgi:glutamyl-Q tRNA(Asp) synthetase
MSRPTLRFAPSPNGYLHLGHAYSALVNQAMAEDLGGALRLRIEDIDPERSRAHFETAIREDLAWLGLRWEEPVRRQSEHIGVHAGALARLQAEGLVYPCFCTRGEVRSALAAKGEGWPADPDGTPLYPHLCKGLGHHERDRLVAIGAPHAWRLDMDAALARVPPLGWTEIGDDGQSSAIRASPAAWGDAVLARRDVPTSYHLSVVMDDAAEGVTHVVRGRDLFYATALHRLLQALLGLPAPLYRHHRLIRDEAGRKLSKSAGSPSLRDLRESGATPGAIRGQLGF